MRSDKLDARFRAVLDRIKIPAEGTPTFADVVSGIAMALAQGDPAAHDGGRQTYGLLQLSPRRGAGYGLEPRELLDPATNAEVGLPPLAEAYAAAVEAGKTGAALVAAVCAGGGYSAIPVLRQMDLLPQPAGETSAPAPAAAPSTPGIVAEAEDDVAALKAEIAALKAKLGIQ